MVDKEKILAGRVTVDAYREAHRQLHLKTWHKGIPEEHTPLLNKQLAKFKELGFNSLQEFFDASELLNVQELGFVSKEALELEATEADRITLLEMWR